MDSVAPKLMIALIFAAAIFWELGVYATCTKPSLNSNSYTLSEDKTSYAVNETYEIYCIPGYVTSSSSNLVCQVSNEWSSASPECTASEGTYPWWMLLVAVLLIVLLVACILPRLLQCILGKKDKKKDVENNNAQRNDDELSDYDNEYDRSNSPVPDFTKNRNRMSNIEFMSKLHKDVDKKGLKRAAKNTVF